MLTSLRLALFRFTCKAILAAQFPSTMPIVEQRARVETSVKRFFKLPKGIALEPVQASGVESEWLIPDNAKHERVILYLHGGGYVTGSPRTHRDLAARIAAVSQARALVFDYRLAPEHPYPAAVEDALSAYRWLIAQGVPPQRIVLAGDSAGGGLALALLLALRDAGENLPAAAVCISPWTDLTMTSRSVQARAKLDPVARAVDFRKYARWYAGEHDLRSPLISPLYADLHGLPPLLIHVATHEILLDDATGLADRARASGVPVTLKVAENLWHVWHVYAAFLPEARAAIQEIGEFIAGRLA